MFIGRQKELASLEKLYKNDRFQFLVLYGRRRIGKTSLLKEFARKHRAIRFSAQQKNDSLNLRMFSQMVQSFFGEDLIAPFSDWPSVFTFINRKLETSSEKLVLIFDEFPFLAEDNPSIKSILQHVIDNDWKERNIFLILCGSNVSFMEKEIMGYNSPLYGRATAQMELREFDYLEASEFFHSYSPEEKMLAYGILGGVPRYLIEFDDSQSIFYNIRDKIVDEISFLYDEPNALLKMENIRETHVYNSILEAIANGYNRPQLIADHIHEEQTKVSAYLTTLQNIRLVRKKVPCGSESSSKKGIFEIIDNFYSFWYRYEFTNRSYYELVGTDRAAREIMNDLPNFMGPIFEKICQQYLVRKARENDLPFIPYYLGKWWGSNPILKAEDDVDVLGLSKDKTEGLFCECKFTNRQFQMADYTNLRTAREIFKNVTTAHYYLFCKGGFGKIMQRVATEDSIHLVTLEDMYEG